MRENIPGQVDIICYDAKSWEESSKNQNGAMASEIKTLKKKVASLEAELKKAKKNELPKRKRTFLNMFRKNV